MANDTRVVYTAINGARRDPLGEHQPVSTRSQTAEMHLRPANRWQLITVEIPSAAQQGTISFGRRALGDSFSCSFRMSSQRVSHPPYGGAAVPGLTTL